MPNYTGTITDFVVGDDLDVIRTISDLPTGQTLAKAWFTVKEAPDMLDEEALIQKTITSVYVAEQGQIGDTGIDGTGELTFILTATDTAALQPGANYYYDIQIKTSANKIFTPEIGRLKALAGVTETIT